jgi:hypothetical protein
VLSAGYLADLTINLGATAMNDYDPDDYEYQELLAERRNAKKNNRYYAQNDPEAPEPDEDDDND